MNSPAAQQLASEPGFTLPETETPEIDFAGLRAQYTALKDEIAPYLEAVFAHGRFILGPEVAALEEALAEFVGIRNVVTVSSGTDALVAPMMALEIGPGDAVFLPAFTFTATAEVPILLGASPVFVDIDPRTYNMDMADLERQLARVKEDGRLTPKAVMPVDLFGLPADYASLRAVCEREGLALISDAAQSFGGAQGNLKVGALAPVTSTSFFPAKPLGCFGDGGAVLTDDDDLAATLRSVRVHGQGADRYDVARIGLNARMDTLQAAVLLGKLSAFPDEIERRNALADYYTERLSDAVVTPVGIDGSVSAWAQYTIQTDNRDDVVRLLGEAGIPTAIYYPKPLHFQPPYAPYGGGAGSLPVSETVSEKVFSLPMHAYMEPTAAERIVDAVLDAVRAAGRA